jgi:hypothetical protein
MNWQHNDINKEIPHNIFNFNFNIDESTLAIKLSTLDEPPLFKLQHSKNDIGMEFADCNIPENASLCQKESSAMEIDSANL